MRCRIAFGVVAGLFLTAGLAQGQTPPPASSPGKVRVLLSCAGCDREFVTSNIAFVEFVAEGAEADVEVSAAAPEGSGDWRLQFTGRGRFADRKRALTFAAGSPEDVRRHLVRVLKLGLAEYAHDSAVGSQLEVTHKRPSSAPAPSAQKDRWNYWIFNLGASTFGNGEQLSSSRYYYGNLSANRTTENWKIRIGGYRSLNKNSFQVDDDETVRSRLSDWSIESLVVKSLGQHWSAGLTASVVGSTYSNQARLVQILPGFEYDIFPYSESTKRSLTFQYTVGGAHYDYETETIFGKLNETVPRHRLNVSLGLRQPWGSAGSSFDFTQQLNILSRTRTTFRGDVSVRITKNLSINGSGSYSRIRDQFGLEKGEATDQEVLLRQRQLATGHRYSLNFGFSFSFGALSNQTVNPRFTL